MILGDLVTAMHDALTIFDHEDLFCLTFRA